MSLNGALQVGRSALLTSQAALRVAGNNMANAATEGFRRRSIQLVPMQGEIVGRGHLVGRGVRIDSIRRAVDTALQARLRDSLGAERDAIATERFLASIESLQGELSDNDLSTLLSTFFNSFSELANNPGDSAIRALVIQEGKTVANRIADLRQDYTDLVGEIDRQLATATEVADDLLDRIASLNGQIVQSENGVGEASGLRDERDLLLDQLSGFLDVTVIEHESGSLDVLVNSIPIVLDGASRGIEMKSETVSGQLEIKIAVKADGTHLQITTGTIGALLRQRDVTTATPVVQTLEDLATELIFQVNRVHSQGQGEQGFTAVTGTETVGDQTANLNSAGANLPQRIENGGFFIHVTHQDSGLRTSHRIDVDGDAMSMDDLLNEINVVVNVPNVTAGLTVDRAITLTADAGYEISFSDDTSGALAVLGVNTFFTGDSALTIDVNQVLVDDPTRLAAGLDHVPGSNGTALAISDLQDVPVTGLGGMSLRSFWQTSVNTLAVETAAAKSSVRSTALVRENLQVQLQATIGVSLDEETINLLTFQRQFQAAARYIAAIDEALQILIGLV